MSYKPGTEYDLGEGNTGTFQFSNDDADFFKTKKVNFETPLAQDEDGLIGFNKKIMGNFTFKEIEDNNNKQGG